jgi:hypothetical protein
MNGGAAVRKARFSRAFLVLVVALAMAPVLLAFEAHAQPATTTVTVVHALPGFTADVYVNGELTLSGFEPETATDPLELPAGRYRIEIRDVGADPTSEPALAGTVTLKAGENLSIIAGLTVDGDPQLNVFRNALTRVPPGRSRLIVRNVADVASIGVRLDGKRVFDSVPHGDQQKAQLEAGGPYQVEATVSGDVAIGPEDLMLQEGTVGIVYAVGSADGGTLNFMVQTIRGLHSSPTSVLTGDGGLATPPGFPVWAIATMMLAALGLGVAAVLGRRRSSHPIDPRSEGPGRLAG